MNAKKIARRERALERLDRQLQRGTKPSKTGPVALTAHDRERISNERAALLSRI